MSDSEPYAEVWRGRKHRWYWRVIDECGIATADPYWYERTYEKATRAAERELTRRAAPPPQKFIVNRPGSGRPVGSGVQTTEGKQQ